MGLITSIVRQVMAWDLSTKDIKLKTMSVFSVDEKTAERILISAKSERCKEAVKNGGKILVFLPQCLRSPGCKASLGENGYECKQCNPGCQVNRIRHAVDRRAPVFIMPGGTLVFKIISREKPDGVFGVACFHELEMAYQLCEKAGIPAVSVPLMRDGCVNTMVNVDEVEEALFEVGLLKKQ